MFEIEKIAEQLASLTLLQASELVKVLEKKFGTYSEKGHTVSSITTEKKTPTKSVFNVVLKSAGKEKIKIIKAVKDQLELGLKDARDRVYALDKSPITLKKNTDSTSAETLRKKFMALGACVDLV